MRLRGAVLLALCAAGAAQAQELVISGSNTARWERYDTRGLQTASPYPFSLTTGYDELAVNATWQPSSFDRWRGHVAGVINDSPYRAQDRDIVPERLLLSRENGEGAIAYRAEAGDFFAFTSTRTQQRPLKGVAVELQPSGDLRQSILLFAGAFQNSWRHLQWDDDNSYGASWLMELGRVRLTANLLRNERADQTQDVASLAAETPFSLGSTQWRAEAEVAYLRGDRDDSGLFAQLSGSLTGTGLSWRLRGERYGQDYRPFGATIIPDRRAAEAHLNYLTAGGLAWRARVQSWRDFAESANPLETRVIGAGVAGPVFGKGNLGVDVFGQELEREDRSLDQRNVTANAYYSQSFGPWVVSGNLLYQRVDDRVLVGTDPRTKQVGVNVLYPVSFGVVSGSIGAGVLWRDVSGTPFATRDVQPTVQLSLFGGPHRFNLNAGRLAQDPSAPAAPDLDTVNFAADYRYRWGRHEFGADITVFDRKPSPGEKTEAYRAGITWTYYFDSTPTVAPAGAPLAVVGGAAGPITRDASVLTSIAPGDGLDDTLTRLSASGITGGTREPTAVVYEVRLLPEVEERQRLMLMNAHGRIDRAALVVSLSPTGGGDDPARVYERVLRSMIERFGRPATTFEEGTFGAGFTRDLAAGRFIRIAEWITPGGTLRLGIPRRLDGVARIEVHHARSFPTPRDTNWGVEPK
ncbi:hypothetical protein [Usitatibacter palustris]|uniref:Uncharacterized protein n=1 Tax=Usitatibacter palustris TaxID=2732487 RepID=A0A6M4HDE3_9PROT|nr:hypothetical protein [Usitatibacter palustris]QJR16748.1 hypothetical protein DSM104440_03584 [Usitatibacter palustris]